MLVVKPIAEVGCLRGRNGNGHSNGKLQDKVEGGKHMSNLGAELVRTQSHQEDDADEEGKPCCDDDKGSELVVVSVGVVGISDVDDAGVVIHLEEFVAGADN